MSYTQLSNKLLSAIQRPSLRKFFAGTFILAFAGGLSRIIGFFYKIFLSHQIGADGMGLFQLTIPVLTISYAVSCAGIQIAISHLTARSASVSSEYMWSGIILSLIPASLCSIVIFTFSDLIATQLLHQPMCAPLLKPLALSIPCATIHACVTGHYYGQRRSLPPALLQLAEQISRVLFIAVLYELLNMSEQKMAPIHASWGILAGEIVSMSLSLISVGHITLPKRLFPVISKIARLSSPVSANRLFLNIFQSYETILVPRMLMRYGCSSREALAILGAMLGMAFPLILFPSVLINSFSTLLLPTVSKAQADHQPARLKNILNSCCILCLTLGIFCSTMFMIFGNRLGIMLFHSNTAAALIPSLALLCPFIYLTTALGSILHGLGKTMSSLCINVTGCIIRILFLVFLIPFFGIYAYIYGMLASYCLICLLAYLSCRKNIY